MCSRVVTFPFAMDRFLCVATSQTVQTGLLDVNTDGSSHKGITLNSSVYNSNLSCSPISGFSHPISRPYAFHPQM